MKTNFEQAMLYFMNCTAQFQKQFGRRCFTISKGR